MYAYPSNAKGCAGAAVPSEVWSHALAKTILTTAKIILKLHVFLVLFQVLADPYFLFLCSTSRCEKALFVGKSCLLGCWMVLPASPSALVGSKKRARAV
jgi:hypothetical protein